MSTSSQLRGPLTSPPPTAMSTYSSSSPPPADECSTSDSSSTPTSSSSSLAMQKKKLKPRVPPEDLSYDDDGFYLRAATVCVRDKTESQVLLVSSPRWGPDCWLVPGGKVQRGESCERGAAREALEEAGVSGKVGRCLGSFDNASRRHRTWVYVLHVDTLLEEYDDADIRRRRWFDVDEAKRMLVGRHAMHCQYVSALENQQQQQQQQQQMPISSLAQAVKR